MSLLLKWPIVGLYRRANAVSLNHCRLRPIYADAVKPEKTLIRDWKTESSQLDQNFLHKLHNDTFDVIVFPRDIRWLGLMKLGQISSVSPSCTLQKPVMKELVYTSLMWTIGSYNVSLKSHRVYFWYIPSPLCVMSTFFYYSGHRKPHIVGHRDFEKELQKYTRRKFWYRSW